MIMLIHGGASEEEIAARDIHILRMEIISSLQKGTGTDSAHTAVIKSVQSMEEHTYFNAGKGSVLAADGMPYNDASLALSDGRTGAIGSSLLATSAILAADHIMNNSDHALLVGDDADRWLAETDHPTSSPKERITKREHRRFKELQEGSKASSFATVGAVALDESGYLAAATSTGGLRGKTPGRVGDSAIVGAGTWCSPECAISFTGSGEHILARSSAARVACQIISGKSLEKAILQELSALRDLGGYAGCIALLASGKNATMRNCRGMVSGIKDEGGIKVPLFQ